MYNDISSIILVNGQLSDKVVIGRGVRQGCPLSPALYVLFVEPLANYIMLHKGIRGFRIPGGRGGKAVKFLQYADDATCVASSQNDVINFFKTFALFERATGASLNLNKTQGLKLGDFVGRKLRADIKWAEDKIVVNGIWFGTDHCIHSFWKLLGCNVKKKLKLWENRNLTLFGRIDIVNSCISRCFIMQQRFICQRLRFLLMF